MTMLNLVFPEDISYGAISTTQFSTTKTITQSGFEQVIANWKHFLKNYDVSHNVKTEDQVKILTALFNQVRGPLHSFLFKDPVDFKIFLDEGVFNEEKNDKKGLKILQLYKKYSFSSTYNAYYRKIKNIISDQKIDQFEFDVFDETNNIIDRSTYSVNKFDSGILTFLRTGQNSASCNIFSSYAINNTNYTKITTTQSFNTMNLNENDYLSLEDYDYLNSKKALNLKTYRLLKKIDDKNIVIELLYDDNNVKTDYVAKYESNKKLKFCGEFYVSVRFSEDSASISVDDYNSYSFPCSLSEIR